MIMKPAFALMSLVLTFISCAQSGNSDNKSIMSNTKTTAAPSTPNSTSGKSVETATFANGCFWCTEAIFEQLDGVISAESGYTGGHIENPTYKQVCTGETGHAECLRIVYDPAKITFDELLEVFWQTHDPTTLNRQGADVGTQYRSAIFFRDPGQKRIAEEIIQEITKERIWP